MSEFGISIIRVFRRPYAEVMLFNFLGAGILFLLKWFGLHDLWAGRFELDHSAQEV